MTGAVKLDSRLCERFSGRKLSESYLVVERLGWTAQYLSSNLEPKRLEPGLRSSRGYNLHEASLAVACFRVSGPYSDRGRCTRRGRQRSCLEQSRDQRER